MDLIGELGIAVVLGAIGVLGLRPLLPKLRRLQPGDTAAQGFGLWVIGFLVFHLAGAGLALWLVPEALDGESPLPISRLMPIQALSSLLAVGILLLAAGRLRVEREELGLRAHRGPSALVVAVCAWLAFYPVFVLVALVNAELQGLFGNELSPQQYLQDFLADEQARSSPLVWAIMVVVLPTCEELLFRGALYGGLRRVLHPVAAVGISALLFGVAHGNVTTLLLPVAALGVALALLYERTASLTTPILFHALHNGLTLALATFTSQLEPAA